LFDNPETMLENKLEVHTADVPCAEEVIALGYNTMMLVGHLHNRGDETVCADENTELSPIRCYVKAKDLEKIMIKNL
jgi:hypothetical protein